MPLKMPWTHSKLDDAWKAYVDGFSGVQLQENCKPKRFPVPMGTQRRGAVFAVHGYTACPQQFFELAERLTAQGYEVFTFLLQGHGRVWKDDWQDDWSGLPTGQNFQKYYDDARAIDEVASAATEGDRVLVSLSVGSTVGLAASHLQPNLFTRQLIFVPFFGVGNRFARYVEELGGDTSIFDKEFFGWNSEHKGPDLAPCHYERSGKQGGWGGRAGICQFYARHLHGVAMFGKEVLESLDPVAIPTQVVGVEGDEAVQDEKIHEGVKKLRGNTSASLVDLCFFPKGVNHSILSRWDSPREDKYWIPAALDQAARFITQGRFFDKTVPSIERPEMQCRAR